MAMTKWADLGVTGVPIEHFYFGQKSWDEGISGRKQASMCVFTFHMSDL